MIENTVRTSLKARTMAVIALGISSIVSPTVAGKAANHLFAAEVREVRSSSINGQQMLTLGIDGIEGPAGCRNSTVLLRTDETQSNNVPDLEAIALRSFMNSEAVVMSVANDLAECIDGMPAVNDMWVISFGE